MYEEKIARVKQRIDRVVSPLKKTGFKSRVDKLERRKTAIEKHIAVETVPRAIFGSRKIARRTCEKQG